jgi:hypothetical protein
MHISRSKVELFIECPCCFYFDVVLKKKRPNTYPLNLNNAVDLLLKREFEEYRKKGLVHPLQKNTEFVSAKHPDIEFWQDPFNGGISYYNEMHNCNYYGAIDDIWINDCGEFAVVDYKSTAKEKSVTEIPNWASAYSRQLSFYTYLFQRNGFRMYNKGFLIYSTAITSRNRLNNQLKFETNLISVELDLSWIEPTLNAIQQVLNQQIMPEKSNTCKYCRFVDERRSFIKI